MAYSTLNMRCKRMRLRRIVCAITIFVVGAHVMVLVYSAVGVFAFDILPRVLDKQYAHIKNRIDVCLVRIHSYMHGKKKRLQHEEKDIKAIDLWENFYYDQIEDATKTSLLIKAEKQEHEQAITERDEHSMPSAQIHQSTPTRLPRCPLFPEHLKGRIDYTQIFSKISNISSRSLAIELSDALHVGGHFLPRLCVSRHRVAILVPYRDRAEMLPVFAKYLHMFLRTQNIDYTLYVVEQAPNQTFNRGKLINAGVLEAMKLYGWECFIFHDVDHFPVDDRNLYTCPDEAARHMAVAVDKLRFKPFYRGYFGGVSAISVSAFRKVDGFSNDFWGWGGEDDELSDRLKRHKCLIYRYPSNIARYLTVRHGRDKENPLNPCREKMVVAARNGLWPSSGLSSIRYAVQAISREPLYTKITVDLLEATDEARTAAEELCAMTSAADCSSVACYFLLHLLASLFLLYR